MSARHLGLAFALFALLTQVASAQDTDSDKLESLAKDLKSKDAKVRVKAAEGFEEFGPKAADYSKDLCDTLLDSDAAVVMAAARALGRVRPELHRHLRPFLFDKFPKTRVEGVRALGALGADAEPAAYFLAKSLAASAGKDKQGKTIGPVDSEIFSALLKIASEEPEVIDVLKSLAAPGKLSVAYRLQAMELLVDWAAGNDDRRKELLPLIKSGLGTVGMEAACCSYAARYGILAKDLLPLLKPLQFARDFVVRDEAERAVEAIEAAIKKK